MFLSGHRNILFLTEIPPHLSFQRFVSTFSISHVSHYSSVVAWFTNLFSTIEDKEALIFDFSIFKESFFTLEVKNLLTLSVVICTTRG